MAEPTLITPAYNQLQAARDGSSDDNESERAVRLARDSGRAQYVPLLLEIAQKRGTGGKRSDIAFEALHAADALADIRMELLAFARNHHNEPWLARCAILILAREYEKDTYQLLKSIYDESQVNFVRNAAVEAHTIKSLETRLRAHERPADQIALVLRCFLCDWNTFTLGDKELHGKQFPRAVWTQRRLRELSTEHPKLAAEAVFRDSKYRNRSEVLSRSYREFLSKFLGDDSRAEFGRLMETSDNQGNGKVKSRRQRQNRDSRDRKGNRTASWILDGSNSQDVFRETGKNCINVARTSSVCRNKYLHKHTVPTSSVSAILTYLHPDRPS